MMELKTQTPCIYGSKCYRKNPQHFLDYSHPEELNKNVPQKEAQNFFPSAKKLKLEKNNESSKRDEKTHLTRMKQTTLQINKNKTLNFAHVRENFQDINCEKLNKRENREESLVKGNNKEDRSNNYDCKENSKLVVNELNESNEKIMLLEQGFKDESKDGTYTRKKDGNEEKNLSINNLLTKSPAEIIKDFFLVDMPQCFYSFYDFCKEFNSNEPDKALQGSNLKLVGPFDVLLGRMNLSISKDLALCHWRYFYDPPEFQTVLATDSGFHIGYWRDDPKESPVFLASNDADKDCIFKAEAENLFGTVFNYLENEIKTSNPFNKVQILKTQTALKEWAEKKNFSLSKSTKNMAARQKKVVTKSFHKLGIVVPLNKKTKVGYRPLLTTDARLKKICKLIMDSNDEKEKETFWEELEPLITAANIANDECDFGNGLELGINLFCMGSSIFYKSVEHLLCTAYSLLKRNSFKEIIKAHLKMRRTGHSLSVN